MKRVSRRTLSDRLFTPVDAASLAVFRIGFGGIMRFEMLRYFFMLRVRRDDITPEFCFSLLIAWFAFQVLLRHLLYPGNVSWTEAGHRFAWHVMLGGKSGSEEFTVTAPASGRIWRDNLQDYLTPRQIRKMATRPDMLLQFARYLAQARDREKNLPGVGVRVATAVSLNGRPPAALVDPDRDLAAVPRDLRSVDWILSLTGSLPALTVRRLFD